MNTWRVIEGDALTVLRELDAGSAQTCVTSPPYFGLRDYGHEGQLGLEATPDEYVQALVEVFRQVRRVLRDDGTLWLNLGDSYAAGAGVRSLGRNDAGRNLTGGGGNREGSGNPGKQGVHTAADGCKPKDLIGIPWMVAFALRADGWYLRSDIIWAKPNPMPESVTDRPTKAHEYLFLLSKQPRYLYDADAVREEGQDWSTGGPGTGIKTTEHYGADNGGNSGLGALAQRYKDARGEDGRELGATGERHTFAHPQGRNRRSVWTVATAPFPGAHFAVFPPKLIEPCILAGSAERACGECGAPWRRVVETTADGPGIECPQDREGWEARWAPRGGVNEASVAASRLHGQYHNVQRTTKGFEPSCDHQDGTGSSVVLDPFAGAGTTGLVATRHGRGFVGIELNPDYAEMARLRIRDDAPLMNYVSEGA